MEIGVIVETLIKKFMFSFTRSVSEYSIETNIGFYFRIYRLRLFTFI